MFFNVISKIMTQVVKLLLLNIASLIGIPQLKNIFQTFLSVTLVKEICSILDKFFEGHFYCSGVFIGVCDPAHHRIHWRMLFFKADFKHVFSQQLGIQHHGVITLEFVKTILETIYGLLIAIQSRFLNIESKIYFLGHATFSLRPKWFLLVNLVHFLRVVALSLIKGRFFVVFFHIGS